MDVRIFGDHLEVTEALQSYIEEKLHELEKYELVSQSDVCKVTLRVVRKLHTIEITIPTASLVLRAEESTDDMYKAVDLVVDKLNRQITKYKTRVNKKIRRETKDQIAVTVAQQNSNHEDASEDLRYVIRKQKKVHYKPMSVEEAVLQMDMIGHSFYVFKNSETQEPNIVYKRKNGDYGLIEAIG